MESPPIVNAVSVSPRVIKPVPAAVTVPFTLTALGAVAITPPVKLMVSVLSFPKDRVPVLANVVVQSIVLDAPLIAML